MVWFLKKQGYLEFIRVDHIHDLGKLLFAFSVFWTYLWFSQYMLIWYANIPEETLWYLARQSGLNLSEITRFTRGTPPNAEQIQAMAVLPTAPEALEPVSCPATQ